LSTRAERRFCSRDNLPSDWNNTNLTIEGRLAKDPAASSWFFEIARVFVRLDHVASVIVNEGHSTM
jgi:hypothetical protein